MERSPSLNLTLCWSGKASGTIVWCGGIIFLCSIISLGACNIPERSFNALLAKIDASTGLASIETFSRAAELAQGTEEKLRLLKRASVHGAVFFADVASIVIAQGISSESVSLAALDAFISSNRFTEALQLFEDALDPETRPAEYVETVVCAIRDGLMALPPAERLVLCADATSDYRFLVMAAIESMKNGDRSQAVALLADIVDSPEKFKLTPPEYAMPAVLFWDAGALDQLANMLPDYSDPMNMALHADAAYAIGMKAEATSLYAGIIERFPSWSWKPYAMLARSFPLDTEQTLPDWPYSPQPETYEAMSQPNALAGQFQTIMYEIFGDDPEVLIERSRWLYSQGFLAEARDLAGLVGGERGAIALLRYTEPERVVSGALRLVASHGTSAAALDCALYSLCTAGAWDSFLEIYGMKSESLAHTRRAWFWASLADVLSGNISGATAALRQYGPYQARYIGAYDLGLLEWSEGRLRQAREAFELAAGLARSGPERARALVMAGDVELESGDKRAATMMYDAALGADYDSRLARARLEQLLADD